MKVKSYWCRLAAIVIGVLFIFSATVFAVSKSINGGKSKNELSQKELMTLYNKGYGVQDIEKACELADKYKMSIDEILEIKGPLQFAEKDGKIIDNSKPWDDVIIRLDVKKRLKDSGATEKEISDVINQIENLRKNGKTLVGSELSEVKVNYENSLIKKYNITDEDIKKCENEGIDQIIDIAMAKDMAAKNNTTLDKVLQIKEKKKSWSEVNNELGGSK